MWKVATARFQAGAAGSSTPLFLEIATRGIWHAGENPIDTSARFGHASDALHEWSVPMDTNPSDDHRNMHLGLPDAIIEVVSLLTDADFNDDGDVDGADYLTWQRGFGIATTHPQGDANVDGAVNGQDLAIWEIGYGSSSVASTLAVPEPSVTLALATCIVLTLISHRVRTG